MKFGSLPVFNGSIMINYEERRRGEMNKPKHIQEHLEKKGKNIKQCLLLNTQRWMHAGMTRLLVKVAQVIVLDFPFLFLTTGQIQ